MNTKIHYKSANIIIIFSNNKEIILVYNANKPPDVGLIVGLIVTIFAVIIAGVLGIFPPNHVITRHHRPLL